MTGKVETSGEASTDDARLPAWMSDAEQAMFRRYVAQARLVLEFGVGGSTGMAAEVPGITLIGIDSHPDWIERVRCDPRVAILNRERRLELTRVNIGPVGDWGMPSDPTTMRKWPTYSLGIWNRLNGRRPDFVFVDGRFRLSCALQALLNLPGLPVLCMHDFWSREFYHPILDFTDVIDRVEELAVLRPKSDLDLRALARAACRAVLDPR